MYRSLLFCTAFLLSQVAAGIAAEPADFLAQVKEHFAAWDFDKDGDLSERELDQAGANPKFTGKAAAALAALKRASRSTKYKLPALNLTNIEELATAKSASDKPDFKALYGQGLSKLEKTTSRDLFPAGPPKLETVHQGRLGNCFCLAPLGAVLHRDPQQVMAMFTKLDDGNYRVTLGKNTTVVAPPTDTEIARTGSNEDAGIWVNLYEKALGKMRNDAKPEAERASSPIDVLARGGSAGTMLAYITGHEITRFSFTFAKDKDLSPADREAKLADLRAQLKKAASERRLMTCGTLKTTLPGITGNHAYAVLGYDEKSDCVKVWNPFGSTFTPRGTPGSENGYPRKEGISEIPVPDFVAQFSGMAFEVVETTK